MILVVPICVRPENCSEWPTSRAMHATQDAAVGSPPSTQDADALTIGQNKARDVDRSALRVFGQTRSSAAISCATGIMRGHCQFFQSTATAPNGRDGAISDPAVQRAGCFHCHDCGPRELYTTGFRHDPGVTHPASTRASHRRAFYCDKTREISVVSTTTGDKGKTGEEQPEFLHDFFPIRPKSGASVS